MTYWDSYWFFWYLGSLFELKLKTEVLHLLPNQIYSLHQYADVFFFIVYIIIRTLPDPHHHWDRKNGFISARAVGWNVEVWREIEQLSDILHFSLEMTNHPISFQRGAILPNLDPQNNFPISKCCIGFKYIKIKTVQELKTNCKWERFILKKKKKKK